MTNQNSIAIIPEILETGHPVMARARCLLEEYAYLEAQKLGKHKNTKVDVCDIGSRSSVKRVTKRIRQSPDSFRNLASVHFQCPVLTGEDAVWDSMKTNRCPEVAPWRRGQLRGRTEMSWCDHVLRECTCVKQPEAAPVGGNQPRQRVFVSTHSAYYFQERDWLRFRCGDTLFMIVHDFQGDEGVIPTTGVPEYKWKKDANRDIVMIPIDQFSCGSVYRHPDLTPMLLSRKKVLSSGINAYCRQEKTVPGVGSVYRFVFSREDYPATDWDFPVDPPPAPVTDEAVMASVAALVTRLPLEADAQTKIKSISGFTSTLQRQYPGKSIDELNNLVIDLMGEMAIMQQGWAERINAQQLSATSHRNYIRDMSANTYGTLVESAARQLPDGHLQGAVVGAVRGINTVVNGISYLRGSSST